MFLAFYTNLAEFLSTRSGILAALIPLIAIMLIIKWWDTKLGVPAYASLKNEQKIWLMLHFLPPQTSARTAEGLGAKHLQACMDGSKDTANTIVRYKKELIEDFLNRFNELGKEEPDLSIVGCSDAYEALGRVYMDREAELSADLLAVWPLQEESSGKTGEGMTAEKAEAEPAEPASAESGEPAPAPSEAASEESGKAEPAPEKEAEPAAEPSEKV